MRVGVACLMQESNTLAPAYSTLDDFSIEMGEAIVRTNRGTNTELGGFLEELDCLNLESVPVISAWAIAGGPGRCRVRLASESCSRTRGAQQIRRPAPCPARCVVDRDTSFGGR